MATEPSVRVEESLRIKIGKTANVDTQKYDSFNRKGTKIDRKKFLKNKYA